MAVEFRLPDIGEGVAEGEIVNILIKPGDSVVEDQPILEVMTDKVTVEIPSPVHGTVQDVRVQIGQKVPVGSVVLVIETGDASAPETLVKQDLSEQEKASSNLTTMFEPAANGKTPVVPLSPHSLALEPGTPILAAPATRKLARELGVNLHAVQGSGPSGRITPEDVKAVQNASITIPEDLFCVRPMLPPSPSEVAAASSKPSEKTFSVLPGAHPSSGGETRSPQSPLRRRISEHLVHAKKTAPHFAYVEEVDMTAVVSLREKLLPVAKEAQISLNYLPFIIKAVSHGLRKFPVLNASLDDTTHELVLKHDIHLGIAVSTEDGLVVPVIHHADQKSLKVLAQEIQTLAQKARENKLTLNEIQGGTFTLTSIGSIGGLFGIPILNHPEVGILGINKITKRPVVKTSPEGQDEIMIRSMMYLSLACDHRVVDGADAARFMNVVLDFLENPEKLLFES